MKIYIFSFLLILVSGTLLTGCSIIGKPAGIKVETDQPANVFIDGKIVGKTPYEDSNIKGKKEITLKIIPEITEKPLASWESKVMLLGGTWTSVKREMAVTESDSSGQVLYMTKNKNNKTASISITADQDGASVFIGGEEKGPSPLNINDLSPADYTVEIKKEGFISRSIKLKLLAGYQVNMLVKLSQINPENGSAVIANQPTIIPGTDNKLTPTPTKSVSPAQTTGTPPRPYITIKDTEVGFLRVREKPSTSSTELARVKPGGMYSLLTEENGWYKIAYEEGKEGWVAGQYVTKYE